MKNLTELVRKEMELRIELRKLIKRSSEIDNEMSTLERDIELIEDGFTYECETVSNIKNIEVAMTWISLGMEVTSNNPELEIRSKCIQVTEFAEVGVYEDQGISFDGVQIVIDLSKSVGNTHQLLKFINELEGTSYEIDKTLQYEELIVKLSKNHPNLKFIN